jgi:hypothetical protein
LPKTNIHPGSEIPGPIRVLVSRIRKGIRYYIAQ